MFKNIPTPIPSLLREGEEDNNNSNNKTKQKEINKEARKSEVRSSGADTTFRPFRVFSTNTPNSRHHSQM